MHIFKRYKSPRSLPDETVVRLHRMLYTGVLAMEFLDPGKEKRSRMMLLMGYGLIALAIGGATLVLLYQSYGYGINRQGDVIQNGLVFVSSQPTGAAIYLNGTRYKSNTNSRVVVPANRYDLKISATGYRDWQRPIVVNGNDVQHFDYPFLFPAQLQTTTLSDLNADPSVALQSPDKRWVVLGQSDNSGTFTQFDLKNPAKPVATDISLPAGSFNAGEATGAQSWAPVEWASDNRHALLQHSYTDKDGPATEYVLLDRDTPADSVNLTNTLKLTAGETVNLFNNRTDQYYVFDDTAKALERVNGSDGSVVSKIDHVLAFKSYSDNKVLYVTDQSPTGKIDPSTVSVVLQDGSKTYTLRTLPAGGTYVLNLAQYSGDWFVAVGASNDTAAYVYKNPQSQPIVAPNIYPAPWRRVPVSSPTFLSFSSSTQFLLVESGQQFEVYDFENVNQYRYTATQPLDAPQTHATWMDGNRLLFVSGGKLMVFDYDYRNQQTLVAANPAYLPFFSSNYSYLYALRSPTTDDAKPAITTTPLTVKP